MIDYTLTSLGQQVHRQDATIARLGQQISEVTDRGMDGEECIYPPDTLEGSKEGLLVLF